MNNNSKSASTAGILGILLGGFGAHDWYLGNKKKAMIHTIMIGAGILLEIIAIAVIPNVMSLWTLMRFAWLISLLDWAGWGLIGASSLWGFIDGIKILTRGSAESDALGSTRTAQGVNSVNNDVTLGNVNRATVNANDANGAVRGMMPTTNIEMTPVKSKEPMNPVMKKKIMIGVGSAVGIITLSIIAIVVISAAMHVDYESAYEIIQDLQPEVTSLYNRNCSAVVQYVDDKYVSDMTYDKYIESCNYSTDELDDLVEKLGETSAVKKNSEIKEKYQIFKDSLVTAVPVPSVLADKLKFYRTWHKFVYQIRNYTIDEVTDAQLQAAADILIKTGYDDLKKYGEGWLEKTKAWAQAQRTLSNTSYGNPAWAELRNERDRVRAEQSIYVDENKPDVATLMPLEVSGVTSYYDDFKVLQVTIAKEYRLQH